MPFDPAPQVPAKPDAAFLSRVLREGPGGPFWPVGFVWDYDHCAKCAAGLAGELWGYLGYRANSPTTVYGWAADQGEKFGLDSIESQLIFLDVAQTLNVSRTDITPLHVADAIDAVLAARAAVA